MLILSRKPNQTIVIGDNIEVTIVSVNAHRVKIGVKAPVEVRVLRSELLLPEGHEPPEVVGPLLQDPQSEEEYVGALAIMPR